jgi:thioredoxin reductase (NADPH)
MSAQPATRVLSSSQLQTLKAEGEERTAQPGDTLYDIGDRSYPFIAILEGEAAILDAAGQEVVRHGPSGFLGEINLLSGQTVFLRAVATKPMRYIAVEREQLRKLLFEDGSLSDLLLNAFIERRELLQQRHGIGPEIIGSRHSSDTRRIIQYAREQMIPHTWIASDDGAGAPGPAGQGDSTDAPLVRLPGGTELTNPSNGELSRALGIGLELAPEEEVDLMIVGSGPAGLGAAVYGASEGLDTLVIDGAVLGGQAKTSRRIENYLGFPAGISGNELTGRAATQARKFGARLGSPYRATGLEPGRERHLLRLVDGDNRYEVRARAVLLATGAHYRRLPVDGLAEYEGCSVFYVAGPLEGQLCAAHHVGIVGGGNSAGQAAVWLAKGGALVTLLHRRADLRETMSHYLIGELERWGVAVRNRAEVAELHGEDGQLEAVTLTDREKLPLSYLFCFLGAEPCTDWLGDVVARDHHGFILTGADAGVEALFETSVPGVYAAGDVRAGSIKRCAIAVGEGATVVRFVHERLATEPAATRAGSNASAPPPAVPAAAR